MRNRGNLYSVIEVDHERMSRIASYHAIQSNLIHLGTLAFSAIAYVQSYDIRLLGKRGLGKAICFLFRKFLRMLDSG